MLTFFSITVSLSWYSSWIGILISTRFSSCDWAGGFAAGLKYQAVIIPQTSAETQPVVISQYQLLIDSMNASCAEPQIVV